MVHTNLGNAGAADNRPVSVVVFASEQTMPPMQFLLHVLDRYRDRLRFVGIYHTDDPVRSMQPADRLVKLIVAHSGRLGLTPIVETCAGTMDPASVRQGMDEWFAEAPDDHWLVNVTGGTKPMSSAATEVTLRRKLPQSRVLYLEMTGAWFELFAATADGLLDARALSPNTDPDIPWRNSLDRLLPIKDLVETQYPAEIEARCEALSTLHLMQVTQAAIRNRWKWKAAVEASGVHCWKSGDAFEKYVGAGLKACGLPGLGHSLKVLQGGKSLAEMDLVCCHQGRIVCLDIKLPDTDEEAKGVQLAKVATDARQIGGTAALAIAIRPGWEPEASLEFQAAALRVKVVTQKHAESLFSEVLRLIDPALVAIDEVVEVEKLLANTKLERGIPVLSDLRNQPFHDEERALQLEQIARRSAEFRRRAWALTSMGDGAHRLQVDMESSHWQMLVGRENLVLRMLKAFGPQVEASQARLVPSSLRYVVLEIQPWAGLRVEKISELAERVCRSRP
jgi:predicted RecB family endonuclease